MGLLPGHLGDNIFGSLLISGMYSHGTFESVLMASMTGFFTSA